MTERDWKIAEAIERGMNRMKRSGRNEILGSDVGGILAELKEEGMDVRPEELDAWGLETRPWLEPKRELCERLSPTLKKRFCKDFAVPVAVFDEPYFSERLAVVELTKPVLEDLKIFVEETGRFEREQDYFEEYGKVKERAIEALRGNSEYVRFNEETFEDPKKPFPKGNLYSEVNVGGRFVSADMRRANFSALRRYSSFMFDGARTWEDWISRFTDMRHVVRSKYVRQVIMGACNPGRQIRYEKILTAKLLEEVSEAIPTDVLCLSADEFVLRIPKNDAETERTLSTLRWIVAESRTPFFRIDAFELEELPDKAGFVKRDFEGKPDEYKCVSSESFHMVVKKRLGLPIEENDLVFVHDGRLARYLEAP